VPGGGTGHPWLGRWSGAAAWPAAACGVLLAGQALGWARVGLMPGAGRTAGSRPGTCCACVRSGA